MPVSEEVQPTGEGITGVAENDAAPYLRCRIEKDGTMPPRDWSMAKARFAVLYGERFTRAMA